MEYPFESLENDERCFLREQQMEDERETHSKCCGDICKECGFELGHSLICSHYEHKTFEEFDTENPKNEGKSEEQIHDEWEEGVKNK